MQQVSNILLGKPDFSQKAGETQNKPSDINSSQPKGPAQDDSFSAALEKAAEQHTAAQKHATEKEREPEKLKTEKTELGEVAEQQETKANVEDEVSQVFAQINLANNFSSGASDEAQVATDGETLPPVEVTEEVTIDDLPEDVVLILSLQSGLDEQALSQLSTDELKKLLEQNELLNASGQLKPEFVTLNLTTVKGNETSQPLPEESAVKSKSIGTSQIQGDMATKLPQDDINNKLQNGVRDIFGKELSGSHAAVDDAKVGKGNDSSNQVAINPQLATEQLKNADLSVRMTTTETGELLSAVEEPQSDVKSLNSLQNQMQQVGTNRQELPQINLSLKQNIEQTPTMQQMIQRFAPVMNQQLITMVSNGVQQAEIRLDPPELGQMMVRIQVQGDTTQVQFQVSQHQTKDLVEQAMPRLREMLAEQGMQLTDGQVSQGHGGGTHGDGGNGNGEGSERGESDEFSAEDMLTRSNLSTSSASGIDYYA
ncbi:flagellar hook-length control protein FliK [Shewanella sairae]|uniref:Flagellar hook-length control protein FliK n=1 Tax=Shewanella sairae TaxID=190310 RepID=A0ABQ4PPR2_9GAMM|nr:flagellar hook-length control protein FliK [Shewanella sairae]MCL1129226.1 flagellar hook-length control protein FliK [Shewanella sairae]GIU50828.1 flagellar hook-length control protein FliK [Shewanella sairae]